jgi:uncharacterized membrane protein YidH (DUF202 family)
MSGSALSPDVGLSNERTALAWQRTALSVLAGAAVLGRLTFDRLGFVALALLGLAVVLCLWVFAESRWRYAQQLGHRPRGRDRGGRAALFLSLATLLIGLTEASALLVG